MAILVSFLNDYPVIPFLSRKCWKKDIEREGTEQGQSMDIHSLICSSVSLFLISSSAHFASWLPVLAHTPRKERASFRITRSRENLIILYNSPIRWSLQSLFWSLTMMQPHPIPRIKCGTTPRIIQIQTLLILKIHTHYYKRCSCSLKSGKGL